MNWTIWLKQFLLRCRPFSSYLSLSHSFISGRPALKRPLHSLSFGKKQLLRKGLSGKCLSGLRRSAILIFLQAYFVTLFFVPAALLSYPRLGGSSRLMAAVRSTYLLLTHPLVSKSNTASFSYLLYLALFKSYEGWLITKYPTTFFHSTHPRL